MFGRKSVYGKHVNNTSAQPAKTRKTKRFNVRTPGYKTRQPQKTGKSIDSFEQEYQKFIADLQAKKAAEKEEVVETPVEQPVEIKTEEPVVEDNVQTLLPEEPVEETTEETVVYVPKKRKRIVNENIQENTEEN